MCTAVSSEAWAKLRDWASVAGRGWLLLSGSVAHASLETAVEVQCLHNVYVMRCVLVERVEVELITCQDKRSIQATVACSLSGRRSPLSRCPISGRPKLFTVR